MALYVLAEKQAGSSIIEIAEQDWISHSKEMLLNNDGLKSTAGGKKDGSNVAERDFVVQTKMRV